MLYLLFNLLYFIFYLNFLLLLIFFYFTYSLIFCIDFLFFLMFNFFFIFFYLNFNYLGGSWLFLNNFHFFVELHLNIVIFFIIVKTKHSFWQRYFKFLFNLHILIRLLCRSHFLILFNFFFSSFFLLFKSI